jgi:hypothetical protein
VDRGSGRVIDSDQDDAVRPDHVLSVRIQINWESDVSVQQAAAASFPREEAILIASLTAPTGGYLAQ